MGARQATSVWDRFFAKVDRRAAETRPAGDPGLTVHWLWTGYINPKGYGYFQRFDGDSPEPAQRVAYMLVNEAPIPPGLQLFNLCGVKHCVRPSHWDLITYRESRLRVNARKASA